MDSRISFPKGAKRRSELAFVLKFLRRRIDPHVRDLGPYVRASHRLGKRVTQEELAEVIGVTREWYAVLESKATSRPSPRLVERLADALMVAPDERAWLLQLALPHIGRVRLRNESIAAFEAFPRLQTVTKGRVRLRDDSIAVLEAFSRLRSLTKHIWSGTSFEDVLAIASEDIANWFGSAVLIEASRRRESGLWESQAVDDRQEQNSASKIIREMELILPTSKAIDALNLYPRLANAGDVGTPELHPLPIRREALKIYARRRLAGFTFVKARVLSRTGLIGGFCIVNELGHSYSASDRAVLGAFAEVASLALS